MKDSTILLLALVGIGGFFLYKGGQKVLGAAEGIGGAVGGIPQGIAGGFIGAVSAPFEAAGGLLGGALNFLSPTQTQPEPAPKIDYAPARAALQTQLTQQSSLQNVASLQNILSTMRVNTPAYNFLAAAIPPPQIGGASLPRGTQVIADRGAYQIIEPSGRAYSIAAPKAVVPLAINVMNPFRRF